MTFGIFLLAARFPGDDDRAALDRAVRVTAAAEEAGFDEVWIAEHHFMPYGVCPSAITFAAHALGATGAIRVGTAVSVLSTTHPVALAEQALLLDNLSGGRFSLGVGRGGPWVDLEVFGTGLDRRDTGFADALEVLLRTLRLPRTHGNDRFPFREVPVVPAPATRLPVLVAATSADTADLASGHGLPLMVGMDLDDAAKRAMAGHRPGEHLSVVVAHVEDSRDEAVAALRAAMPGWLRAGLAAHVPVDDRPGPSRDPDEYTDLLCELHPVGDPAYCAARLATAREATGIGRVAMMVEGSGDTAKALRTVRRLGREVLPELRV